MIIMGVAAKLFYPETMIFEAILVRVFISEIGIYSHNSAYYDHFRQNNYLIFLGHLFSIAAYHYVHHSAEKKHSRVNLGNGRFMCWDRLFGTYIKPPEENTTENSQRFILL